MIGPDRRHDLIGDEPSCRRHGESRGDVRPLIACDVDLRPGGAWRYLCRMSDGEELAWHGEYREIEAPARIVSTEVFEGFPDAESLNTMTLSEDHGVTTLQTLVQHSSKANLDGHVDSGMEGGMQQIFDRLDDLVERAESVAIAPTGFCGRHACRSG